ncbi:MAG: magnesium/cobalt transporter CorA [Candidatus Absconditabacterales bacterium]
MANKLKNIGLAPGAIVYTGDKKTVKATIEIVDYSENLFEEKEIKDVEEIGKFKKGAIRRINLIGIDKIDLIKDVGEIFNLHPLVLEDIVNTSQRPKVEDMDGYLFAVIKMCYYDKKKSKLDTEQISLIISKNFVMSFQEKEGNDFDGLKERIKKGKTKIRKMKSDYLGYSLIDIIVDNYFVVLEQMEEEIEEFQDKLLTNPGRPILEKIQNLKQNMISLRKSIWPVREIINTLQRTDSDIINQDTQIYLRDLYDHTVQIIDTIETFRDIIAGSLDIYLSSTSNRLNEVMKVLTVISTIFIPLTFLVGVYGMNFRYMPELGQKWTYPILWIIMLSVGIGMFTYFKRKKWI